MPKGCTPENVEGALVGVNLAGNNPTPFSEIDDLSPSSTSMMQTVINQGAAEQFDANPGKEGPVVSALGWPEEILNSAKNVLNDTRNPSGFLGEDFIQPVHQFLVSHLEEFGADLQSAEARRVYFDQIDDILESLPEYGPDDKAFYAADRYKRFYQSGGELYGKEQGNAVTEGISNLAGNVLQNSPTVILGNVAEGAIKLPTLYPKTFLPAMQRVWQATNGNPFQRIPELEAKGVYGSSLGLEKGIFGDRSGAGLLKDGLIGLTDNPLKSIAYYAGELAHGDGLKGVQDVAFVPRLGDLPMVYYNSGSRSLVSFLGYTINTYKMYGQMWKDLSGPNKAQAAQRLLSYHLLAGMIGGAGAAIPQPAVELIKAAFPESEEFFDENRTPLAGLIQPGAIDRVGITADIASRNIRKIGEAPGAVLEASREEDYTRAVVAGVDGILGAASFSATPLGDAQVQKALRMGRDAWLDDEDIDPVKFLPFIRE